jgi:hypothetical protein
VASEDDEVVSLEASSEVVRVPPQEELEVWVALLLCLVVLVVPLPPLLQLFKLTLLLQTILRIG